MQYFFYILSSIFLYINYKIVLSDIKYKKIPNKLLCYLLILLPFYYIYLYFGNISFQVSIFGLQICITMIVSFVLYNFGVWSAGDAKYLGVLSLFIPSIGIIPFIGNIALLTLAYLIGYFLYFYLIKNTFNHIYRKSLWKNIKNDLSEKTNYFLKSASGNMYTKETFVKIIKSLILFFIVFVTIRLSRMYLLKNALQNNNESFIFFNSLIKNNSIYFFILFGVIFIFSIYLMRSGINKFKNFLVGTFENKKGWFGIKVSGENIDFFFLGILGLCLGSFITFEFFEDRNMMLQSLYKIFTLYLMLYLLFKIVLYSYKITFGISEQDYIKIGDLKEGEIVDRDYLIKIFGTQSCLGYCSQTEDEGIKEKRKDLLLYPNPGTVLQKIHNPIDKDTLVLLTQMYDIVNKNIADQNTTTHEKIEYVRILKTFAFGIYIFMGFLMTYSIGNQVFEWSMKGIFDIIKNMYH